MAQLEEKTNKRTSERKRGERAEKEKEEGERTMEPMLIVL